MTHPLDETRRIAEAIRGEIAKAIVGQEETVEHLLIALVAQGHVLLEGAPGTAKTFLQWAELFRSEQVNALDTPDQSMFIRAGGDPMIHYLHGYWTLGPNEALVIETRIPECLTWNFQLDNYWMESLDYRYSTIHLNDFTAKPNADGTVTVVVAARDPGFGNWIDTCGHPHGTMLWRWTGATDHPVPQTRVVTI